MLPLRMLDDDPSILGVNPWEEELRGRREKRDEEEERPAIEANSPPKRPSASTVPKTPKGLALVFAKVDHQIELLDKQVNNVRLELLQARSLVTAVKTTVGKLNKPEASKLFEEDVLSNYLRIGDKLKGLANNIVMIVPDHGRQVVLAEKAYTNPRYPWGNLDGYSAPGPTVLDSMIREPSNSSSTGRHDYQDPHDTRAGISYPDKLNPSDMGPWPRTRHRTQSRSAAAHCYSVRKDSAMSDREQYSSRRREGRPRILPGVYGWNPRLTRRRRLMQGRYSGVPRHIPPSERRVIEEPSSRHIHGAHYDPILDSENSTDSERIIYNNLTDSSDSEDSPPWPYRANKRPLPPWRNPAGHTQRKRKPRPSMAVASRQTRPQDLYSGQKSIAPELQRNLVAEQIQTERSTSDIKGNWWNRLTSKFRDQIRRTKKQDRRDTGK